VDDLRVEHDAGDLGVMKARSLAVEPLHELRPTRHGVQQFDIHSGHPRQTANLNESLNVRNASRADRH